ncbi:MAG: hypothetical protein WCJ58_00015 [bacterium]
MRFHRRTSLILLVVTFLVGLSTIFIAYQLQKRGLISPEDFQAGGGNGACCVPSNPSGGCVTGWKCIKQACTEEAIGQNGVECPAGSGKHCKSGMTCSGSQCKSAYTCVKDTGGGGGGDCASTICEWPQVVISGRCNNSVPVCHCARCNGISGCSNPSVNFTGCSGNPPTCNPGGCPAGYVSCGTTVDHESVAGCTKTATKCKVNHPDCNNPSYVYRYCKPSVVNSPTPTTPVVNTPTQTVTPTPTTPVVNTPTRTVTPTPTTPVVNTPTRTLTPTPTTPVVNTPTRTNTPTPTPTGTRAPTPTPTQPGSLTATPSRNLPHTAITTSDQLDRVIVGMILVIGGFAIYWMGFNRKIEEIYWKYLGKKLTRTIRSKVLGKEMEVFIEKMMEKLGRKKER